MFCNECGARLKEGMAFCTNCGSKLEELQPQTHQLPTSRSVKGPAAVAGLHESPQLCQESTVARGKDDGSAQPEDLQASTVTSASKARTIGPLALWAGIVLLVAASAITALIISRRPSAPHPLTDTEIVETMRAKFAADTHLSKCTIEVLSEKGVVTLTGTVNSEADKSAATAMAAQLPGVKEVKIFGLVVNGQPSAIVENTTSATGGAENRKVEVPGSRPWTPTGIYVQRGDTLAISASGGVSFSAGSAPTGPGGEQPDCYTVANGPYGWKASSFVANQLPCNALLGRIGDNGTIFYVGTETAVRAPATGQLFLGVNDNNFADNSGSWLATVTLNRNSLSTGSVSAVWLGFANGNAAQDRDSELRQNCGAFTRVYVPENVGNRFTDLCTYQGKICEQICDWQGQNFPCTAGSLGGARDGTRVVLCR